ncbi:MAG TPA: MBL fold metallo-hydrolase [Dongiaceae bacterium]|jgi:glyoxylase-like metal-dependent hydrolase (beta-lactamase superfamily II)|nr:MBL fold metallo-hydrolase [Dongiaceae bacterium]
MLNDRNFEARYGVLEQVSPLIRRIVAENPGPYTFFGTGTYVVGRGEVAVIDPGPLLDRHVDALLAGLAGETVTHILITHTHTDHSPAAEPLKAATGAKTHGFAPHGQVGATGEAGADLDFRPDVVLRDGDVVEGPGWHLTAHHTPGHTSNHLCYALEEEAALFSGDHVMGWSTTVIVPPDGSMADYMRSLSALMQRGDRIYWPTHGGPIRDPKAHVSELIGHRVHRREQILFAMSQRPMSEAEIARAVYVGLDPRLRGAAEQSTLAHLLELAESGAVALESGKWRRAR